MCSPLSCLRGLKRKKKENIAILPHLEQLYPLSVTVLFREQRVLLEAVLHGDGVAHEGREQQVPRVCDAQHRQHQHESVGLCVCGGGMEKVSSRCFITEHSCSLRLSFHSFSHSMSYSPYSYSSCPPTSHSPLPLKRLVANQFVSPTIQSGSIRIVVTFFIIATPSS